MGSDSLDRSSPRVKVRLAERGGDSAGGASCGRKGPRLRPDRLQAVRRRRGDVKEQKELLRKARAFAKQNAIVAEGSLSISRLSPSLAVL